MPKVHSRFIRIRVFQDQFREYSSWGRPLQAYRIVCIPIGYPLKDTLPFILESAGIEGREFAFFQSWGHWEQAETIEWEGRGTCIGEIFTRKRQKASLVVGSGLPITLRMISESSRRYKNAGALPFVESEYGQWADNDLYSYSEGLASWEGASWLAPSLASAVSF